MRPFPPGRILGRIGREVIATDLRLDVIPAMKVVLDRNVERHDRHTSMIVADALLDLLHLLHAAEQDLARAKEFIGAGRL